MATKFPNSGRLNYSQRKLHPKSPDLYGELVLERSYLRTLLDENDGDEIPVKLDAWQNDGQYGTYFSLKVNTWKKPEGEQPPARPAPPQRPAAPPPVDDQDVPF
jgi:hypothetical protein